MEKNFKKSLSIAVIKEIDVEFKIDTDTWGAAMFYQRGAVDTTFAIGFLCFSLWFIIPDNHLPF